MAQRLKDEHDCKVLPIRVALTFDQVRDVELPESFERAKKTSPNYKRYHELHPDDKGWELDAVKPTVLQKLLTDAIESVIDKRRSTPKSLKRDWTIRTMRPCERSW
jgi:hypothetical protein